MIIMRAFILTTLTLLFSGCVNLSPSSKQTEYYLLTNTHKIQNKQTEQTNPEKIGIAPVKIADYLDRPQLVTMTGQNKLTVEELSEWGGRLDENITRVIVDGLRALKPTQHIIHYQTFGQTAPKKILSIHIEELIGNGDNVHLRAHWSLTSEGKLFKSHVFSHNVDVSSGGLNDYVAAINQAVNALTSALAAAL